MPVANMDKLVWKKTGSFFAGYQDRIYWALFICLHSFQHNLFLMGSAESPLR